MRDHPRDIPPSDEKCALDFKTQRDLRSRPAFSYEIISVIPHSAKGDESKNTLMFFLSFLTASAFGENFEGRGF